MKKALLFIFSLLACSLVLFAQPVINSFTPASGPIGTSVAISGQNFNPTPGNNVVYFGTAKATVTAASSTSLTVTVPVGATYRLVSITTGGLTGYSAKPFNVFSPCDNPVLAENSFVQKGSFATGLYPYDVAVADMDNDGKLDIVTPNLNSNTVSVLRNLSTIGAINFAAKVDFPAPAGVFSVAIGDLDGDGKLDMAVTNSSDGGGVVSVFRNTSTPGALSFASVQQFNVGASPRGIAIGDIDGDGKPEIVTANLDLLGSTSILKNSSTVGTIAFGSRMDLRTAPGGRAVTINDLNGDGKPDIAVAGGGGGPDQGFISLFRNTSTPGSLSLVPKVDVPATAGGNNISAGDLDGDGKLDLVVASLDNNISVHRNTGSGSAFAFDRQDYNTYVNAQGVVISDLDGDSKPDLATAGSGGNSIPVFKNQSVSGNISFPTRILYQTGFAAQEIAAGDLDGDGKPDLVTANTYSNNLTVLRNQVFCPPCVPPTFVNNGTIVRDASCGMNDGQITIIPTYGTAPFQYSINGGATYVAGPDGSYSFENLAVGTYQLRLKDANGCESAVVTKQVNYSSECPSCTPPTFLNNGAIVLDASCNGNDGNISIIPTSGTGPFMYSIDGGATYVAGPNSGYTFQNLAAGTYMLRLKAGNGCQSAVVTKVVKANAYGPCVVNAINPRLRSSAIDAVAGVRAYPNPSHGQFQVQLQGFASSKVQVQILDIRGSVLQSKVVNASENTMVDINLQGKAKGLYLVRVISDKGTQLQKVMVQ